MESRQELQVNLKAKRSKVRQITIKTSEIQIRKLKLELSQKLLINN
ncbi:hypothetical protein FHS10_001551 [Mucilaginibacter dorajii]|nr:hypothetical protein [Mucilaginibacter dorajii]